MSADLVFVDGRAYLGGGRFTDAVAVRNGRIFALGDASVRGVVGPRTEVVTLGERLLLPGFQDAHIHPVAGGVELGQCDLSTVDDQNGYLRIVRAYAKSNPELAWIRGGGWAMPAFPDGIPDRKLLDLVVDDRPVFLANCDHHGAWVNTRALELAGITKETPDPPDGRIEREPDGTPNGMLQEGAADLVARLLPPITEDEQLAGLLRAQRMLHSLGVTAWQDAALGDDGALFDPSEAYLAAQGRGLLTARVTGALWWRRDLGAEQIESLLARSAELEGPRLRARTVKIMQDGVAENFTAAMLEPYLGQGDNRGHSFVPAEQLGKYVSMLDSVGFQVHFHALGDRAVREALDAVAQARAANGDLGNRHHLAHLQIVHPDDVPRFAALNASANIQPLWACNDPQMTELTIPFLGPERTERQYPFAALLRSGAQLAAGSDWPVSSPDPIKGIHVAVNRTAPGTEQEVFLPEQRLELAAAIDAYTAGSAYVSHADDTGSLKVGNRADLALLDRDPFRAAPREIAEATVVSTFVDGNCVHES